MWQEPISAGSLLRPDVLRLRDSHHLNVAILVRAANLRSDLLWQVSAKK